MSIIERRLALTRQMMEAKKEARRQKQCLRKGGDYLGVQGVNPATGQLDTESPTDSEGNSIGLEVQQKLKGLRNSVKDARYSYWHVKTQGKEARKILDI